MVNFISLAHPNIQKLKAYTPGKPIEEVQREFGLTDVIKLASNENPLGPSPRAILAAQKALAQVALYPDGAGFALKNQLAATLQCPTSHITLGNGSDNLLSLLVQAFAKDKAILISEYSFDNYAIIARGHGVDVQVAASRNWGVDVNALKNAITPKTTIIFIANPNNPTGTYITQSELEDLLEHTPSHVLAVLDEAYFEYVTAKDYPNTQALQENYPNVVITRTFSKAYGLAGLRVGYSISHPDIADILNRIRLPFNVSTPAMAAACAALQDSEHLEKTKVCNQEGMQYWIQACKDMHINFIPSVTNFITLDLKQDTQDIFQKLLQQGIIVRPLHSYQMPNHLRITIGLKAQNERALAALKSILEKK